MTILRPLSSKKMRQMVSGGLQVRFPIVLNLSGRYQACTHLG